MALKTENLYEIMKQKKPNTNMIKESSMFDNCTLNTEIRKDIAANVNAERVNAFDEY